MAAIFSLSTFLRPRPGRHPVLSLGRISLRLQARMETHLEFSRSRMLPLFQERRRLLLLQERLQQPRQLYRQLLQILATEAVQTIISLLLSTISGCMISIISLELETAIPYRLKELQHTMEKCIAKRNYTRPL